jgi:hypothetical protein
MKNLHTFEEFLNESQLNESVKFTKSALIDKLKQKLVIADKAIEKYKHPVYVEMKERIESAIKAGKIDMNSGVSMVQGGDRQENYEIFIGNNAMLLAKEVAKVIKKYKKKEVADSSMPAMAGYGNVSASVSGSINGRVNFHNGKNSYLIAVTIGGGVDSATTKKIKNEIFPLFYMLDEYNNSDGGVMLDTDSGTNYDTIGLTCSNLKFAQGLATNLQSILDGK